MDKKIIKCAECGAEFNILKADWCTHQPRCTKLCPNGHCICDRLDDGNWRPSTALEKRYGIQRVYLGKKKLLEIPPQTKVRGFLSVNQ